MWRHPLEENGWPQQDGGKNFLESLDPFQDQTRQLGPSGLAPGSRSLWAERPRGEEQQ